MQQADTEQATELWKVKFKQAMLAQIAGTIERLEQEMAANGFSQNTIDSTKFIADTELLIEIQDPYLKGASAEQIAEVLSRRYNLPLPRVLEYVKRRMPKPQRSTFTVEFHWKPYLLIVGPIMLAAFIYAIVTGITGRP